MKRITAILVIFIIISSLIPHPILSSEGDNSSSQIPENLVPPPPENEIPSGPIGPVISSGSTLPNSNVSCEGRELIYNGDFTRGLEGWTVTERYSSYWERYGDERALPTIDTGIFAGKSAVRFMRYGFGGWYQCGRITQYLEADVSAAAKLVLSVDVYLQYQQLGAGGYWGWEYPAWVMVEYLDAQGNRQIFRRAFYYWRQYVVLDFAEEIPRAVWYHYSADLLSLTPPPVKILSVSLQCNGWDAETYMTNVSLRMLPKLELEWIKVYKWFPYEEELREPYKVGVYDHYNIVVSIRNPTDVPQEVTVTVSENGQIPEYDDTVTYQPEQSVTQIIPAGSSLTFTFTYHHHWRWLKPLENLGPFGTLTEIFRELGYTENFENIEEKLLDILIAHGAKPTNFYKYRIVSFPEVSGLPIEIDLNVTIFNPFWIPKFIAAGALFFIASGIFAATAIRLPPGPLRFAVTQVARLCFQLGKVSFAIGFLRPGFAKCVKSGLSELNADNLVLAMSRLLLDLDYAAFSLIEAESAALALDSLLMMQKLSSAQFYLELACQEMESVKEYTYDLIAQLRENVLFTEAEILEYYEQLAQTGLPPEDVEFYSQFIPPEEIPALTQALISLNPLYLVNYEPTLMQGMDFLHETLRDATQSVRQEVASITVPVMVDADPDVLNPKSEGKWVTVYIETPAHDPREVEIDSVRMFGEIRPVTEQKYGFVKSPKIEDRDGDGYPELTLKFEKSLILDFIKELRLPLPTKLTVPITGLIAGRPFYGEDNISILSGGISGEEKPKRGPPDETVKDTPYISHPVVEESSKEKSHFAPQEPAGKTKGLDKDFRALDPMNRLENATLSRTRRISIIVLTENGPVINEMLKLVVENEPVFWVTTDSRGRIELPEEFIGRRVTIEYSGSRGTTILSRASESVLLLEGTSQNDHLVEREPRERKSLADMMVVFGIVLLLMAGMLVGLFGLRFKRIMLQMPSTNHAMNPKSNALTNHEST
jgi:hypothetical protein